MPPHIVSLTQLVDDTKPSDGRRTEATLLDELSARLGYERAEGSVLRRGWCFSCGAAGASLAVQAFHCASCGLTLALEDVPKELDAPGRAVYTRMSDVERSEVRWLWPGRIPLGRLTILDGDPGLGKSTVTLDIAARITRGDRMPDGSTGLLRPRGVVLLGAEDGLGDTVGPRLDAAAADCSRVGALVSVRDLDRRPRLPSVADVCAIRQVKHAVDAALLVIDPLAAYMGPGVDGHRDIDVRTALAGLAELAERTGLAVLLVRHLNKSGGSIAVYRGGGSIAYIAAARSGLLLARDPDDEGRRILAMTKCNLAPMQPSLALRLDATITGVRVAWDGSSKWSASDLLTAESDDGPKGEREQAAEWLQDALADGPRRPADILRGARQGGISEKTLRRAKELIGVVVATERDSAGRIRGWNWALPDQAATHQPTSAGGQVGRARMDSGDSAPGRDPDGQGETAGQVATVATLGGWNGTSRPSDPVDELLGGDS